MSRRPSLLEGAIRVGGDPNEKIREPELTLIYDLDDPGMMRGENIIRDDNHITTTRDPNRRLIRSKSHRSRRMAIRTDEDEEKALFVLYKLFEESLSRTAKETARPRVVGCTIGQMQQTHKEDSSRLWSNIRQWFSDNPSDEDRHTAANLTGAFTTVSLHLLCKHSDPPLDVLMDLIESAPEAGSYIDDHGWLPLHYACAQGACEEVLKVLIQNNPMAVSAKDNRLRTPLHFAFFKSGSENIVTTTSTEEEMIRHSKTVEILIACDSAVAQIADEKGRLPLHFAAAYGSSITALKGLIRAYPESVNRMEDMGRTPLHYVMANAHGMMSPATLQLLLEYSNKKNIHTADFEGNLPFHLLSERAAKYNAFDGSPSRQNVEKCLNIFLNMKPPPAPIPEFFTALQSLPQWLRDSVVTNAYVQDILHKNVSRRFPTLILLMDLYSYALIISCFSIAANEHIRLRSEDAELRPQNTGTIVACFIGSSYFLVREILDVISMISLGTFKSWFFDLTNWFDVLVIGLVYYYCGAMIRVEQDIDVIRTGDSEDDFRTGAIVTLLALWIAVINFMKTTSLDFAVFFETMKNVLSQLYTFLVALLVFLIFFAQMFHVVFRKETVCSEPCMKQSKFPHCDFQSSLMKVFTMMVGEIEDIYQDKLVAQLLYFAFACLVVVLFSNILIAIVVESHSHIKNERAEILFWSNRLYFVSEMVAVASLGRSLICQLTCLCCCIQSNAYTESATHEDQAPSNRSNHNNSHEQAKYEEETGQGLFREVWHELMLFVQEDSLEDLTLSEFLLSLFLRCLVCILLIPLWLLGGVISAGWLWPPQVREFLSAGSRLTSPSCSVPLVQMGSEIHRLTHDVIEMSSKMRLDIDRVRTDFEDINIDVEEYKKACTADITEIKEAMSILLETYEVGGAQGTDYDQQSQHAQVLSNETDFER